MNLSRKIYLLPIKSNCYDGFKNLQPLKHSKMFENVFLELRKKRAYTFVH